MSKLTREKAELLVAELIEQLSPFCARIMIVGSVARKVPYPRDIDLLCHKNNEDKFLECVRSISEPKPLFPFWLFRYKGVTIDLFCEV